MLFIMFFDVNVTFYSYNFLLLVINVIDDVCMFDVSTCHSNLLHKTYLK